MLDDDCDSQTDEDWPELGSPCDGNDPDLCANGIWQCSPDGQGVECFGDENVIEICNGIDDNCDWQIDEGNDCNDGLDCTIDYCDNGICFHEINPGWCFIDGECWGEDAVNPANPCLRCDPGADPYNWTYYEFNACPPGYHCDPELGCVPD